MTANKETVIEAVKTVYDPEIPVNVYDLGLIYNIDFPRPDQIAITMTLTSPACPVAQSLPEQVRQAVITATGIDSVDVEVVWDPPWSQEVMSDEARLALNLI
ncbi:MAG: iron-sulfur cluster assembly protein [Gammaproteobacteria bacterium]|jgi:FeS assembly SUF system protein